MESIYQEYSGQGLRVFAVNAGGSFHTDSEETISAFVEQTGISFPPLWDTAGSYSKIRWPEAISPFPRQALISKDGHFRYIATEHNEPLLRLAVEAALAE